ncbi:hypothetical protein NK553_01305 [Pseudomonas sp. ZM23]|uniref:Transmembrane protein n=1 Tax=Pseudomonas triclosanedens TaxID=2961893 RepID=A0ABY7A0G2_9PSED|nr:hypothetical protein [Pseudomonas triclosanedens]MCP8462579.1 hypothetical protein [Pseudomonas triclosanedens]MCP8468217.1 hypothetical protein [Pseudomonas triclosanedens]MCP8474976.1 hypothetical protein [Pseudomonas triclosanedens]WAI49770.1 hypothetical protein OU419_00430 [Pseudomonas triclosanedens]
MTAMTLPDPSSRRRGRVQLLLILGMVLGPMLLATAMYKLQFWVPEGRVYHGDLIATGQTPADLGVQDEKPGERWQLLVTAPDTCASDCQQLVYLARQINIGLGREASRAEHVLAFAKPLPAEFAGLLDKDYPRLQRLGLAPTQHTGAKPQLWIVDPHGNLVLRYDADANGKSILKDLQLLLKLSNIG